MKRFEHFQKLAEDPVYSKILFELNHKTRRFITDVFLETEEMTSGQFMFTIRNIEFRRLLKMPSNTWETIEEIFSVVDHKQRKARDEQRKTKS